MAQHQFRSFRIWNVKASNKSKLNRIIHMAINKTLQQTHLIKRWSLTMILFNPCATHTGPCFVLFCLFFDHFACYWQLHVFWHVCIIMGLLLFYFHSFNKSIFAFRSQTSSSPLKPITTAFLIAVTFNCKIMQFLLIGFYSVGKG